MPDNLEDEDHPLLSEQADASQRGGETTARIGADPYEKAVVTEDPKWLPPKGLENLRRKAFEDLLGDRPYVRNDNFWPYLLIRAVPGDRGARPLYPPTPCWESPDILLMPGDTAGEFDRTRLVAQPEAGQQYRVFVHVWNLGLFDALGVQLRVFWVNPGFFSADAAVAKANPPTEIGGAWTRLGDRTQQSCHGLVEIAPQWNVSANHEGHECLIAVADSPLDPHTGRVSDPQELRGGERLDANTDRHVAQRNLTIANPEMNLGGLFGQLSEAHPAHANLHILHAGAAAAGLIAAYVDTVVQNHRRPPIPDRIRGLPLNDGSTHIAILTQLGDHQVLVSPLKLNDLIGGLDQGVSLHDVDEALRNLSPPRVERIAVDVGPPHDALGIALRTQLPLRDLMASSIVRGMGASRHSPHLLRFVSLSEGELIGGYSSLITPALA
jgi:hypothetical protein